MTKHTFNASAILSLLSPNAVNAAQWEASGNEFNPHNKYTIILSDYDSFEAARVTLEKFGMDAVAVAAMVADGFIDMEVQYKDEDTDTAALHFYNGLPDRMPKPKAEPIPSGFHYILIDPDAQTVTSHVAPSNVKPSDCYAFFRPIMGCRTIEAIGRSAGLEKAVLLVDENAGCYDRQPTAWTMNGKIILGKAVLIGVRGDYFATCRLSVPEVRPMVTFGRVPQKYRHGEVAAASAKVVALRNGVLPGLPGNPF